MNVESVDLAAVRESVAAPERAILDHIWKHANSRNFSEWPTTRETNIQFSLSGADALQKRLPAGALVVFEGSPPSRYQLTFLGLLLTSKGTQCEALLVAYLDYLRVRARTEPSLLFVKSSEVKQALALSDDDTTLLGQGIYLGRFHGDRGSGGGPAWGCDVPHDLDALMAEADLGQYVRNRALPRASERHEASPTAPADSSDLQNRGLAAGPPLSDHDVVLEPEQVRTLELLVEAARREPSERRSPFRGILKRSSAADVLLLIHPGFPNSQAGVYPGDIDQLADEGLVRLEKTAKGHKFDITARGFQHYANLKLKRGEPIDRFESALRTYVDAAGFRERHPAAFGKWREAEQMVWSADSREAATMIGHLCREAHQCFATSLLQHHPNPSAPANPVLTKNRVTAALAKGAGSSERLAQIGDSLTALWSAAVDLTQRQEHGEFKGGRALTWEDSRRVVFVTLFAMLEIDRLASTPP